MMQRLLSRVCRVWAVLFLTSLTLCLGLRHPSLKIGQVGLLEIATAQSPAVSQLVQQGLKLYQAGDVQGAIKSWQTALETEPEQNNPSESQVSVRKYLTRAYQQVGQPGQAIAQLDRVIAYYRLKNEPIEVGRMLTEQAQLYSSLGQHRRAIALLCGQNQKDTVCSHNSALDIARRQSDALGEIAAWGSLGNAHRLIGEYDQAIQDFERSLEIAKRIDNQTYLVSTLNGLANAYAGLANRNERRAQFANETGDKVAAQKFQQNAVGNDDRAVQYFENSLNLARIQNDRPSELRSLLGLLKLYRRQHRNEKAVINDTLQQALVVLEQLPDSRDKAYAAIQLANLLQLFTHEGSLADTDPATRCPNSELSPQPVELLNKAVSIAQHIQDKEAQSFAQGRLGHIYECRLDYQQAMNLTQQALVTTVANESIYLWQWQAGRLLKAQGRVNEAIDFYEQSVNSLKRIRSDLALQQRDYQFDFRDNVEPVYRELIEFRLEQASHLNSESDIYQQNLESVLKIGDELRLAELQNYLGNDCALAPIEKPVALVEKNTAVLSSFILKDRLAIILTVPDGDKRFKSHLSLVSVNSQELRDIINDLRLKLEKRSDLESTYKARAEQVYGWFIRPFVSNLEQAKIETLVFIQDGILRSIPMAALFDGKQFLVQKYAIANAPALSLANPTQSNPQRIRVLAFGLTQKAQVETATGLITFAPLSQVKSEIDNITTFIPKSQGFLNREFTSQRLQQELEKKAYPVIHLATHGKFGIDAKDTFLVTGNLVEENPQESSKIEHYNEKLTMNELYQVISSTRSQDNRIELLTLTACQTAVGSDREALGLAGISIQAGAESAIASLWQVDDAATVQLITKFYQSWRDGLQKAKALQAAQVAWLEAHQNELYKSHPAYWAPFILIGNWL